VRDCSGNPIEGVQIATSTEYSATTDASGRYTIANVLPGTYILTPTRVGYFWSPASRDLTVPPNATGQDFTAQNVQKEITPGGIYAVNYGDSLTYTVHLIFPEHRSLVLFDQVPTYTTYIGGSLNAPTGVIYDSIVNAMSGTLSLTAATLATVSFAVEVGITGTAELAPPIVNRACVYPVWGGLADCIWSNEVRSYTYVWHMYMPMVARNY
jgi:hypothetical protein